MQFKEHEALFFAKLILLVDSDTFCFPRSLRDVGKAETSKYATHVPRNKWRLAMCREKQWLRENDRSECFRYFPFRKMDLTQYVEHIDNLAIVQ